MTMTRAELEAFKAECQEWMIGSNVEEHSALYQQARSAIPIIGASIPALVAEVERLQAMDRRLRRLEGFRDDE